MEPGWYLRCRYQHWGKTGIEWTDWFLQSSGVGMICKTRDKDGEQKIKELIKEMKQSTASTDKITKLKHEYDVMEITPENDPTRHLVELTKKYRAIDKKKSEKEERRKQRM